MSAQPKLEAVPALAIVPAPEKDKGHAQFCIKEYGAAIHLVKRGRCWYIASRICGERPRKSLQTGDVRLAKDRAAEIVRGIVAPGGTWRPHVRDESATLDRLLAVYRECQHCEPRTLRNNAWALLHMLEIVRGTKAAEEVRLSSITGNLVIEFQEAMARRALLALPEPSADWQKRQAREDALFSSRSVVNQARSVFTSARLDLAAKYKDAGLELPACVGKEFVKRKLLGKASRTKPDEEITPPEVVSAAIESARELDAEPEAAMFFWLALGGGIRKSEIASLQWEWFSESAEGWAHVSGGMGKNGDKITVPIQPRAWAVVKQWQKPSGPLFARSGDCVARIVNDWLRAKGWKGTKVLHDLRAVVLSRMCDAVSESAAMTLARHHEQEMVRKHYSHHRAKPALVSVL